MLELFKLYQKLKSLAKAEKELIEAGDFDSLKNRLAKKNELINQIDQIDQKEYFSQLADSCDKKELKEKKDELYQLIKKISELQEQNMQALEKKKEVNKEKMLSLYSREKSIKGYLNSDKYEAKFFDEKS